VHARPIVLLDVYGHFSGLLSWLGGVVERGFASRSSLAVVTRASNVSEALDACAGAGLPPDMLVPATAGSGRRRVGALV
jgi:putative lysine decarboxylase